MDPAPELHERPPVNRQDSFDERMQFVQKPSLFNSCDYKPSITTASPAPKLGNLKRDKFNSTATIFMNNAMRAPDVKEIVTCLSRALYWNIKNFEKKEPKRFREVFSEEKYPFGDGKTNFEHSPSREEIEEFLFTLFLGQDLSAECGVMTAAYIDRLHKLTGITLHASNWRRIVLGALVLSSKVWEDLAVWNVDFLSVFPNLNLQDLNRLEREYLSCLQFTVSLTSSVYAKYYFELRALSDKTEEHFPLKPLDARGASQLEARSIGLEEDAKVKNIHVQRSFSLNPYEASSNPVSIEEIQARYKDKIVDNE